MCLTSWERPQDTSVLKGFTKQITTQGQWQRSELWGESLKTAFVSELRLEEKLTAPGLRKPEREQHEESRWNPPFMILVKARLQLHL